MAGRCPLHPFPTYRSRRYILALKDLPPAERDYWKIMFDHYIFQTDGDPVAHIPARHQGGLGRHTREIRAGLIRALQQVFSGRSQP